MVIQPDFALYDRAGQLAAVVEVKNRTGTTPQWASAFRQNLTEAAFSAAKFFLLVTPDRVYCWKNAGPASDAPPDIVADAQPLLRGYFEDSGIRPNDISAQAFEMLVAAWLSDLVHSSDPPPQGAAWLRTSGLLDAVRDGRVDYGTAA
jgi:hypothetical protein